MEPREIDLLIERLQDDVAEKARRISQLEAEIAVEREKPFSRSVVERLSQERNILHETVSGCARCTRAVVDRKG